MRLLGDHSEAEDAAQEAFLRAYERLHTFDVERPVGPWVRRVDPGDLAVTTDYRDILGELYVKRLKNAELKEIFPGWELQERGVFV